MKTLTIFDLYDRVEKTIKKEREKLLHYEDAMEEKVDFFGFEIFEFLVFLEVRDMNGQPVFHYPVSVGHEPILKEIMLENIVEYNRLLPGYSIAMVAVENSFINWDEWDLLSAYTSPKTLADSILQTLQRESISSQNSIPDSGILKVKESVNPLSDDKIVLKQIIEKWRFSQNEDHEPLPLVISLAK